MSASEVRAAVENAFRDYATAGVPASGAHEPDKADIRYALGVLLESTLAQLGAGITSFATKALMDADPGAAGDLAYVYDNNGTSDDPANGYYQFVGAAWEKADWLNLAYLGVYERLLPGLTRINLWPDDRFQLSGGNKGALINGKRLYNSAMLNATWEPDVVWSGGKGVWRHAADGSLFGINLDLAMPAAVQAGLAAGDTFSVAFRFRGALAAKNVYAAYRFYNGGDTTYTTAQAGGLAATTNADEQVYKIEGINWPVGSTGINLYLYSGGGAPGVFDILDIWFVRGDVAGDVAPLHLSNDVLDRLILEKTTVGDSIDKANAVALRKTEVTFSAQVVDKAAVGPASGPSRSDDFCGWADTYPTPANADWDAIRLHTLNRSPLATTLWGEVHVVVKTHAAAANGATATVLAVGYAYVDPAEVPLSDVLILLRDPVTGAPKRVTEADMLGDTLVGYYCRTPEGNPAACSEITGSTAGLPHRKSYYNTPVNGDPLGDGWSEFAGNPTLGLEMVTLTDAEQTDNYYPTLDWLAATAASLQDGGYLSPRQNRIHGARLRRWRAFMASTALAGAPQSRFGIAFIGDSWTASATYYQSTLARLLINEFGDGGVGYCSFGFYGVAADWNNTGADARNLYSRQYTGAWDANYRAGSTSPDCADIRSSTAGHKLTLRSGAGATHPAISAAKLHFTGTADGVIRWRWNGGAWSGNTAVQGGVGVQQVLDLPGFPAGALVAAAYGAVTLEVEVVAGSVILGGVDLQSATNGVYFHKLGSSGGTAQTFMTANAAQWQAGFAALGASATQIFFATNEQAQGQAPGAFASYMHALAARVLAARPATDLLFVTPPENLDGRAVVMPRYPAALAADIDGVNAALCDLQPAFGSASSPADYGPASAYPLIGAPGNPHPDTGADRGPLAISQELDLMWRVG